MCANKKESKQYPSDRTKDQQKHANQRRRKSTKPIDNEHIPASHWLVLPGRDHWKIEQARIASDNPLRRRVYHQGVEWFGDLGVLATGGQENTAQQSTHHRTEGGVELFTIICGQLPDRVHWQFFEQKVEIRAIVGCQIMWAYHGTAYSNIWSGAGKHAWTLGRTFRIFPETLRWRPSFQKLPQTDSLVWNCAGHRWTMEQVLWWSVSWCHSQQVQPIASHHRVEQVPAHLGESLQRRRY